MIQKTVFTEYDTDKTWKKNELVFERWDSTEQFQKNQKQFQDKSLEYMQESIKNSSSPYLTILTSLLNRDTGESLKKMDNDEYVDKLFAVTDKIYNEYLKRKT